MLNDACAEACGSGENFDCVDHYVSAKAEQGQERFPIRLHFKNPRTGLAYAYPGDQRDEQFVVGAAARSCPAPDFPRSVCQPIQSGIVDAANEVTLDVVVDEFTRQYKGMIEVERPSTSNADPALFKQLGWRDRYMPPAFVEATEFRFYVFWRGWFWKALQERPSKLPNFETAAPLAIYLEDCMGAPARSVRMELLDLPDVEVLHQTADGVDLEATDTGSALVGDVLTRDRAIAIQAVQVETGRVVARRNNIYVRPGWTTHVWLTPRPAR